jgi:hypothetical protein
VVLNTNLTDIEVLGNYIEAAFWTAIGLAFLVRGWKRRSPFFALPLIAGTILVLFGGSDVVEAQTGAWWRPLWLLAWKGACLGGLAWCYWRYRQIREAQKVERPEPET